MRLRSRLLAIAMIGALPACVAGLPPGGIAALDGIYEGEMARSGGPPMNCPASYRVRMTVTRGEVLGEVFDQRQPSVPADRFTAFIEADGQVLNTLRVAGMTFGVRGRFGDTRFVGTADSRVCALSINAARRP